MIVLVIVAMVIIFLAIGSAGNYFLHRDDVAQTREESAETINERMREDITASLDTGGNIVIDDRWDGGSEIQGIMIRCDNGTMFTAPAGQDNTKVMEELSLKCG